MRGFHLLKVSENMTKSNLPPIPSIGESIKNFVYTFSHVNKGQTGKLKIDLNRISSGHDKHPKEVEKLLQNWMSPLEKADPDFYKLLLLYFYTGLNSYADLHGISFGGLKRKEAMEPVLAHIALPIAAVAIKEFSELSNSPDPSKWLDEEVCPTAQVIDWYLSHISMTAYAFAGQLFPSENDVSERTNLGNALCVWREGGAITIKSILSFYDGQNDLLARWLLLARAWQNFWKEVPEPSKARLGDIWKARLLRTIPAFDINAISQEVGEIILKDARHKAFFNMVASHPEYQNLISLRSSKSAGDETRAKQLLKKLYHVNPLPEMEYQLDADKARFQVQMAQHNQALKTYDKAFEAARYRDGKLAKCILSELITVEAFLNKTKFTKKWSGWADMMDLTPNINNATTTYFKMFPLDHHYPEANLKKLKQKHDNMFTGIAVIDEGKNRPPDLRNPDRKVAGSGSVPHTQLMNYATFDNSIAIQKLLNNGADANIIADDGGTALLCAIQAKTTECINILLPLSSGKALNSTTRKMKISPLSVTIEQGDLGLIQRLLKAGADPNLSAGASSLSPLYDAVGRCSTNDVSVESLLSDEAISSALNQMPVSMRPSTSAFKQDQIVAMRQNMVEMLKDPRKKNIFQAVAHHISNDEGVDPNNRQNIVSVLIQAGADVNAPQSNFSNYTPLLLAAELGNLDAFIEMHEHDGNLALVAGKRQSALLIACSKGHHELALTILDVASEQERAFLINTTETHTGTKPIDWVIHQKTAHSPIKEELLNVLSRASPL